MPSGGVFGRPITFSGAAAALGVTRIALDSPLSGRATYGRSLRVKNTDLINSLGVYLNEQDPITLDPGELLNIANEMLIFKLALSSVLDTGADALAAVRIATAAALPAYTQNGAGLGATLTDDGVGILTVDGVAAILADRILVKDGAAGSDNGIYEVTQAGTGVPATVPETAPRVVTVGALPAYTQSGTGVGALLTADAVGVLTVDGVATVLNDRILVRHGVAGSDNGLYEVTTEGTGGVAFILTRVTDHDEDAEVTNGDYCIPTAGTQSGLFFQVSAATVVVDTDDPLWIEVFPFELTRATDHDTDAEVTSDDFTTVTAGSVNGGLGFQITTADPITVDTTAVTWSAYGTSYEGMAVLAA